MQEKCDIGETILHKLFQYNITNTFAYIESPHYMAIFVICFWMNFALNKRQKLFFVCNEWVHFRWNEGVQSHFLEDDISMKYDYNINAKFN